MFVLQDEARWTWPVTVRVPGDAGNFEARQFRARFRLLPEPRRRALEAAPDGIDQLLRDAVIEVLDVTDEGGAPRPHSPALLDAMLGVPWVRRGLIDAYVGSLVGTEPSSIATPALSPAAAGN